MRLTEKLDEELPIYFAKDGNDEDETNTKLIIQKLGQLEDVEEELGIDLLTLFDSKYTETAWEMELEPNEKTVFFDGDTFFGHYTAEQFLKLIKDMLSIYKQLLKLGH